MLTTILFISVLHQAGEVGGGGKLGTLGVVPAMQVIVAVSMRYSSRMPDSLATASFSSSFRGEHQQIIGRGLQLVAESNTE